MKKIILSILLVSLTKFENQLFVEAQQNAPDRQGKQGKQGKRPPPGWTPPDDMPPPPAGWKPGDPIPPVPEGWTPPSGDNSGKREKGGNQPQLKGGKSPRGKQGGKQGKKEGKRPPPGKEGKKERNQAPEFSTWQPQKYEREIGDIIDIRDSKTLRGQIADLNYFKMKEPFFIFFMNQTCDECKKGINELAKLGKKLQDNPKIARADCTFDKEACDLFVNHMDASEGKYPFMIMATPQRTYIYEGPIDGQKIYNDFIAGDKYLNFAVHGGKGHSTKMILEDGMKFIQAKQLDADKLKRSKEPWWVDEIFASLFAGIISALFFHLGYDYWRKEAKIIVFITGILVPISIIVYQGIKSYIEKNKNQKKIEEAVKKIKPY